MVISRLSDIMTPMIISERGVIMLPMPLTTVSTGAGKCRPSASMAIIRAVEPICGVIRFRREKPLPVNRLY